MNRHASGKPDAESLRRGRALVLAIAAAAAWALVPPANADVVILKDGYTLHGKVFKDQVLEVNEGAPPTVVPKIGGFTKVDDGARIVIFSPNYRQVGDVQSDFNKFADDVKLTTRVSGVPQEGLDPAAMPQKDPDFDKDWIRKVPFFLGGRLNANVQQQIVTLTPHYIRMNSNSHNWAASYLTQEWGPEKVIKLIKMHPDLKEDPKKPSMVRRRKLILFITQARWFDYADREIETFAKDFPEEKMPLEEIRSSVLKARIAVFLDELEIARAAGRYKALEKKLAEFPKEGVSAAQTLNFNKIKIELEGVLKKSDSAHRHLETLVKSQLAPADQFLIPAGTAVLAELHPDAVGRLETFVTLADQVDREIAAGRATTYKPEELLSLAVTGWLLGKSSAETKPAVAKNLWDARQALTAYLSTDDGTERRKELARLTANPALPPIDELAQIATLMPPPFVNKDFSTALKKYNTGRVKNYPSGVDFYLQLPPEFNNTRRTPILVLLPSPLFTVEKQIAALGDLPARFGYVVVCPIWNEGIRTTYTFSEEERGTVPALLAHLQRFLQYDSDRVFLFGLDEAANMAYDVGLAHPDLFAGVTAMCPIPSERTFDKKASAPSKIVLLNYWQNAQQLPLYLVLADRVGKDLAQTFERTLRPWMSHGFPTLASVYKGRSPEYFAHELPFIFDWMSRKKRSNGLPGFGGSGSLGNEGIEIRTMRQDDNHFYWIGTDSIQPGKTLKDTKMPGGQFVPAHISAQALEGNKVSIKQLGFNQLTVWVPRGLFEVDKPIKIFINNASWENGKKPFKPNLGVMLEDMYERADRQHPVIEKFEFKGPPYFPR